MQARSTPSAPHAVLLVLDATVGQNALSQVEVFGRIAGVTGLVMTKLDGTARGGILVALAEKFGLPVHFIGVGEGIDDLEPFTARDFARAIAGIVILRRGRRRCPDRSATGQAHPRTSRERCSRRMRQAGFDGPNQERRAASAVQARDRTRAADHLLRRQRQVQPVHRHRRVHGGGGRGDDRVLCGDEACAHDGDRDRRSSSSCSAR